VAAQIREARSALDAATAQGMDALNNVQRSICGPVPVPSDCSWRCDLSKGLCVAMDDGSDWVGMMFRSGRWVQGNPYLHYEQRGMAALRDQLAQLRG
jgi:hypothetical protein